MLSSLAFPQGSKRRQLLATLRALEAASLPQPPPSLPGSDSEEEVGGKKKKRPKKAVFARASIEVEEKRKKNQKQGPPSNDTEEKEVKQKKCLRRAFLVSDPAAEEKTKRKCQNQALLNPAQHLDNVDQKGTSGGVCLGVWGESADPMYDRGYLPPLGLGSSNKKHFQGWPNGMLVESWLGSSNSEQQGPGLDST